MTLYQGLLFDLDHTLFDYELAQEGALKQLYDHYSNRIKITFSAFKYNFLAVNKPLWEAVYAGKLKTSELKIKRFNTLSEKLNIDWDECAVAEYYINALGDHGDWLPDAESAIKILTKSGYHIGVLTNGYPVMQNKKKVRLNLTSDICSCFVISDEHGISKPDRRIFEIAVKQMGLASHQVLMIGDSLVSDGCGAQSAGLDFCWINSSMTDAPPNAPNIKFTIPSVKQLYQKLQSAHT